MEPDDLKSPSPADAALDAWLRARAPLPPLPDDGFSERVLAALPRPVRKRSPARALAGLAGAVLGVAIAAWGPLTGKALIEVARWSGDAIFAGGEEPRPAPLALALLATAASLAFAHRGKRRRLVRF